METVETESTVGTKSIGVTIREPRSIIGLP